MSIRITSIAATALAAALAGSAVYAGVGTSPNVVVQPATAEPTTKTAEKQYCVRTTITGSRMPQKVCRTRKAWLAEGFDPLAPN